MSEIPKTVRVTCPRCGATGEAPIWEEIDAQTARRDARHVLDETLFEVKCNQCGNASSLNYPLTYHDGELRFFVQYVTSDEALVAARQSIEATARHAIGKSARAQALNDKNFTGDADEAATQAAQAPGALMGYTLRIVTSRNALREKVVVLRNGLDDRAVEVLKVTTFNLAAQQGKLKGATEPFFGGIKKSGDIVIDFVGGRRHREMKVPASIYNEVREDVEAHALSGENLVIDRSWAEAFLSQRNSL